MKKSLILSLMLTLITGVADAQQTWSSKQEKNNQEVKIEVISETSNSWDGKQLPNYPTTQQLHPK